MMRKQKKSNPQDDKVVKPPKKRFLGLLFGVFGTVFVALLLLLSAGIWKISTGPLDIAFAKPTIQEALKDSDTGMRIDFDQALLHWPDLKGPLLLGLRGGKVYDRDDRLVVSIDSAALSLNKAKLLLARISPEGLILRKPSVLLKRSIDNEFSIGLNDAGDNASNHESAAQVSLDDIYALFGSPDSDRQGRLAKLKLVRIEDAQVLIDDAVLARSWQVPRVDLSLRREQNGLRSTFDIDLPRLVQTPKEIIPNIEGNIFTAWGSEQIEVDTLISQFHVKTLSDKIPELADLAAHDVRLDATVNAVLGQDFSIKTFESVLYSKAGSVLIPEEYEQPIAYRDFGLKILYDLENKQAKLEALKLSLDGFDIQGHANVAFKGADFHQGFHAKGRIHIPEIAHEQIVPLWPKSLEDDDAKEWVIDKLSDGVFRNASADFEVIGRPDDTGDMVVDLDSLVASLQFENLSAKYLSTMAPATKGAGKAEFDYESEALRIELKSAQIMDMNIPQADLNFKNIIAAGKGMADLDIAVQGSFQSMLRYLSDEPIGLKMDADLKDVKGTIDTKVKLKFPTRDDVLKDEIEIGVKGIVSDAYLPMVVKDLPLSGGPYAISIQDGLFSLSGKGQIDGRGIDLSYSEYLFSEGKPYASKTTAKLEADQPLREKLGIDLSEFLEGSAGIEVEYITQNDGSAVADIKANITPAKFFMKPFDYLKMPGDVGETTFKAHLQNEELIKITDLKGTAPDVTLAATTLGFRTANGKTELSAGQVSAFSVGQTRGSIEFEVTPQGLLKLAMQGPFADLRPFLDDDGKKNEPYAAPPMQISASADVMRTTDKGTIKKGKIYADLNAKGQFNQFEFDAIAGDGMFYMRFKPDARGKRVFRFEADDAGETLKAFDIYPNIRGGKMVVYGEPIRGIYDRNLIGKAEIKDFRVVDAPALAQIVSALSLPGAAKMLGGEGLTFTKLESDFDWLFRPRGSLLVLKEGRTSGNSLGLTFDGTFDNAARKIDVSGTIIPLSGVNNLLKDIPLVGNILGGNTGLFAATYSIKGDGKEPEVFVNPLSVLAPGILRNILFEGGPPSE